MKFLKKLKLLYCLMFVILANCQTVDEVGKVMGNEKAPQMNFGKKNQPLVIPPNLRELPVPGNAKRHKRKNKKR